MKGNCRECGEAFRGRPDKRFCSDHCRSAYNNRRNRESTNLMRTVHNRLRRNHRILLGILGKNGHAEIRREHLANLGFDFQTITSIARTKGKTLYKVYDLGYQLKDGSVCKVIRAGTSYGAPNNLFPVVGVELEGGHHDVFPADLPYEQTILHNG